MKYLKYVLFFILVLTLIFFGSGLLTPSISYESEIVVKKPANESWAFMGDAENLPNWIEGYQKNELISGEENTVGAVSKVYVEDNGQEMVMEETITTYNLNEHLGMTFTMDFMNMDYDMYFKEKNGKTTILTKSKTVGNNLFAKSMISFMGGAMKKQEDENLSRLKALINKNTKNYFPKPVEALE